MKKERIIRRRGKKRTKDVVTRRTHLKKGMGLTDAAFYCCPVGLCCPSLCVEFVAVRIPEQVT